MLRPKKIVLWGHKLYSHTHSYIHYGFQKAFLSMGYEVLWLDNADDVSGVDFSGALFITECQVDQRIPIRRDCHYVLHNCDLLPDCFAKYEPVKDRCLCLRKFSKFPNDLPRDCEKIGPYTYFRKNGRILVQPWATDLLPNEINPSASMNTRNRSDPVLFIGTIGAGEYGNINQVTPFRNECEKNGLKFRHLTGVGPDEATSMGKKAFMLPAMVGQFQIQHGYIACRIFKAISCGHLGMTNSWEEFDLLEGLVAWNQDTAGLFHDGIRMMEDKVKIRRAMILVAAEHTYLNRINTILSITG